jgi:hypothetical protein
VLAAGRASVVWHYHPILQEVQESRRAYAMCPFQFPGLKGPFFPGHNEAFRLGDSAIA